jgi:hypothetical protein
LVGKVMVVSSLRRRFYTERIVNTWNQLPVEIANLTDHGRFKAALRNHLRLT